MHACFSRRKNTHTFLLSLIPQGPWGGRWAPASVWGHPGAGQDHASAVAQDSGPGPQQQGQGEIRPAVLPSRRPPAVVGHLLTQLRGARWRRLPPHLRPHREASDPSASAHGLPAPRPRPALMLPPASVLGGQGGAPTSLQKGTVREAGANGLGVHRPPPRADWTGEGGLWRRERQQAVSPPRDPRPPPPALPTCLLMSALHPKAGELERLGPSAGHRGPRPQVQKESPFLCRQEARPVHHIPVRSCPWKPSPHRQALPAACCLHPSPHHPLSWLFVMPSLGEMSILFLCLIFGSVVCLPVEL